MSSRKLITATIGMPLFTHYLVNKKRDAIHNSRAAECDDPEAETRRAICILDPQPN